MKRAATLSLPVLIFERQMTYIYWRQSHISMVEIRHNLARALTVMAAVMAVQAQTPAGPFTAAQATAGRTAYQANCASCHLPDLSGRNEAPQLAGTNLINAWGDRPVSELIAYICASMP